MLALFEFSPDEHRKKSEVSIAFGVAGQPESQADPSISKALGKLLLDTARLTWNDHGASFRTRRHAIEALVDSFVPYLQKGPC